MLRTRALGVLLLAAVAGCGQESKAPPPAPGAGSHAAAPAVEGDIFEVKRGKARRETPCVGVLKAKRTTRIGPQVSGRIAEVLVKEGDAVIENQELARLDTATFEIEVSQREADLDVAKISFAGAELQYSRIKNLWDKVDGQEPTVSRKAFDDAKIQYELAKAHVKQDEQSLRLAKNRLAETVLKAPYAGVVTRRFVDPGEPVTSTPVTQVLEIQQANEMDLDFHLPQSMLERFHAGSEIMWSVDGAAAEERKGEIAAVMPDVDDATRSFRCRATVPNADGRLKSGMLARVRVVDESATEAIFVPAAAVEAIQAGSQVLVVRDGNPAPRAVKTGAPFGDSIEITSGLAPGDRILVPRPRK